MILTLSDVRDPYYPSVDVVNLRKMPAADSFIVSIKRSDGKVGTDEVYIPSREVLDIIEFYLNGGKIK